MADPDHGVIVHVPQKEQKIRHKKNRKSVEPSTSKKTHPLDKTMLRRWWTASFLVQFPISFLAILGAIESSCKEKEQDMLKKAKRKNWKLRGMKQNLL